MTGNQKLWAIIVVAFCTAAAITSFNKQPMIEITHGGDQP